LLPASLLQQIIHSLMKGVVKRAETSVIQKKIPTATSERLHHFQINSSLFFSASQPCASRGTDRLSGVTNWVPAEASVMFPIIEILGLFLTFS